MLFNVKQRIQRVCARPPTCYTLGGDWDEGLNALGEGEKGEDEKSRLDRLF